MNKVVFLFGFCFFGSMIFIYDGILHSCAIAFFIVFLVMSFGMFLTTPTVAKSDSDD